MKKILLGLGVVALLSTTSVQAQNEKGQMAISVGAGQSLFGNFFSSFDDVKTTPVINGMFDFAVSDVVSMGLGLSFQSSAYNDTWSYFDANNNMITEDITLTTTKINAGVRINFHYARGIDNLDMYSGMRIGYSNWSFKNDSSDPLYDAGLSITIPVAMQIVPFAMRYYFTDMIGLHLETGLIGPYFIAGGVSLKM